MALCSLDRPSMESLAEQFNVPQTTNDYTELLTNPQIDTVLITSATNTHVEISQAAAKAGKHIFCEKPIALDLKEIDETLAIVGESGR